ncbi:MAG: hypothetical protein U1C04_18790 [Hydrogenophaga sp.]|uniref:zinc ribbon domain-containing protein n=1 Tax=Hydrogenophaga sp. TaxID=1904254 RepID=UPI002AB7FD26|nr:hypothetical protein [Hydrogenophaga sp.]MDZ4282798.1 hypothetical protein [Hydrogenophaga sp.]
MNSKKCLKCGHAASFNGDAPLACPSCGAVYAKVEQAAQTASVRPAAPRPAWPPSTRAMPGPKDHHDFARELRATSLYPTWRELVKWITRLWYAGAVIGFLATAIGSSMAFAPTLIAFGVALAIVIIARAGKELSLMLTDLSDAAVRLSAFADEQPRNHYDKLV